MMGKRCLSLSIILGFSAPSLGARGCGLMVETLEIHSYKQLNYGHNTAMPRAQTDFSGGSSSVSQGESSPRESGFPWPFSAIADWSEQV